MPLPSLFQSIRKSPSAFFPRPTFSQAVAYINGYDAACCGGLLNGFREWLIVRVDYGDNLPWNALVLYLTFPKTVDIGKCLNEPDAESTAIDSLFHLLDGFYADRDRFGGWRQIYMNYDTWLRRQDWYDPNSTVR